MKIAIKTDKEYRTSIKLDETDMSPYAYSYRLLQEAGSLPELILTIPIHGEMNIEIPDSAIVIEKEVQARPLTTSDNAGMSEKRRIREINHCDKKRRLGVFNTLLAHINILLDKRQRKRCFLYYATKRGGVKSAESDK